MGSKNFPEKERFEEVEWKIHGGPFYESCEF